ncbi:MAG TPA: GntR family transcriptional regulator [Solirubrobacteraceae bacterium]|jgi:GntR family transcriptional regulator|nr:GntR family transcriptional regulator [Solirubrobacteraceae bacterium]
MAVSPKSARISRLGELDPGRLDRASFVPLYYQLQELLKEQIESGVWAPGEPLPSEPDLARGLGVSRVVVRQALAILEDDRQIVRLQGRGTFVAQPKLEHRAGGLSRLLMTPRGPEIDILVLDKRVAKVEQSIRRGLEASTDEPIFRLTTLLSMRAVALAIGYSFLRRADASWLEQAATVGHSLDPDLVLADHGVELTRSAVSIETSQCGRFEATHFGIAPKSAVFLVLGRELRRSGRGERPFEVARVEYRGDVLQFHLELGGSASADGLEATYSVCE